MAMLLMSSIFERTWGHRAGALPEVDYWPEVIGAVKAKHPGFQFIAEAYWDLEWELQQHGCDFCYDKRLYDRIEHDPAESVRLHLSADLAYQQKLLRFIENHDEPRAAAVFTPEKHRAAAVTALTLPGARLIHEGQLEGRRVRLPVFLARRPEESPDLELPAFYKELLDGLCRGKLTDGTWQLCECTGWPDNTTFQNLVSWCWKNGDTRGLIVVNFSGSPAQGRVRVPWEDLQGEVWRLKDVFTDSGYERDGNEMFREGLYVDLAAWGAHFLEWL
jgi:hypothetical protein